MSPTVGLAGGVEDVVLRTPPPVIVPPTFKFPPIPTPPYTARAPVVVPTL